jgi:hypothetical protein
MTQTKAWERIVKTKFMVVIKHVCKMTGVKFVSIEKLKVRHQDRVDYGGGTWVEK